MSTSSSPEYDASPASKQPPASREGEGRGAGSAPCGCSAAPHEIQAAVADLHAATLAVVLHTESLELKSSCASYWTRILARYYRDEAFVERLRTHLHAVQRRAWKQAEALGGGLIARGLAELVRGTRDEGPIELEW